MSERRTHLTAGTGAGVGPFCNAYMVNEPRLAPRDGLLVDCKRCRRKLRGPDHVQLYNWSRAHGVRFYELAAIDSSSAANDSEKTGSASPSSSTAVSSAGA